MESILKEITWQALRHAEDDGIYTNGMYKGDMPCTRWVVGDYKVVYLTDDLGFHAKMLTEEMMDDLIIEEA